MSETTLRLDYANLLAPHTKGGVDPQRLSGELAQRFAAAYQSVETRRAGGDVGFFDLPAAHDDVARVKEVVGGFGGWFQDVVVLGIGGSGLGAVSLRDALLGPFWNERSEEEREGHRPSLHVVDNPDPVTFRGLLQMLDPNTTLFIAVSKSGSTAETMALYLVARGWIESRVAEHPRKHFVFITDPTKGALRQIADADSIPVLPVPENVGGRFSVLSPVGLMPAAMCGVDVDALLAGAAAMEARCRTPELEQNPAGVLATLLHAADTEAGRPIHVLMPYVDRLRSLALWFQQLWAESLGKAKGLDGAPRHCGPTPMASVGATDQHSLLQLFMEGPHDKVVLFITLEDRGVDVEIPRVHPDIPSLAYLGGKSLGRLLDAERRATAEALRREGRPNATLVMSRLDAFGLGQLYMLFQVATMYGGALYGVDPLDQPGVELGKILTYGLMGREGYDAPSLDPGDPQRVI